jgi:sugar lactone lactonase YvrE
VVQTLGSKGTGPGRLDDARGLALDGDGYIYVAEYEGGRVQRFTPDGKFERSWIVQGKGYLSGLAADRAGNVYLSRSDGLRKFKGADGTLLWQKATPQTRNGLLALPDGNLLTHTWIAGPKGGYSGESFAWLDPEGTVLRSFPDQVRDLAESAGHAEEFAVDGQGVVYATSRNPDAVFKFAPDGKYLNRFGSAGSAPGQINSPNALALDGQDRLYIADTNGIQVFDKDGRYLARIPQNDFIPAMVFDDQDNLFLIARNSGEVRKLALTQK